MDDLEAAIDIYIGNQNPEALESISEFITNFYASAEGFSWAIENYGNFQRQNSYIFAISIIHDWIKNQPNEIKGTIPKIYSILFEITPKIVQTPSKAFAIRYSKTCIAYMCLVFQNIKPDIFNSVYGLPPIYIYALIEEITPYFEQNDEYFAFYQYLRSNQHIYTLTDYIENKLLENDANSIQALSNILKWADATPINPNCYKLIATSISSIADKESAFIILRSFFSKLQQQDSLEFIAETNLIQTIQEILKTDQQTSVFSAIGEVVNEIGLKLIVQEVGFTNSRLISEQALHITFIHDPTEIFNISKELFKSPYDDVSKSVFNFITMMINAFPDDALSSLDIVFERLRIDCQANTTDTNYTTSLLKLIYEAIKVIGAENFIQYFNSLFSSIPKEVEYFPFTAAIFKTLNYLKLEHFFQIPSIVEFVDNFSPILEQEPPLSGPQMNCLLSFVTFFKSNADQFDDASKQQVVDRLIEQVGNEQSEDVFEILSKLLGDVLTSSNIKNCITISDDLLLELTTSGNAKFIEIACNYMYNFDDKNQFKELYSRTLEEIASSISDFDQVELILKFLKDMKYCESFEPFAAEALSKIIPEVQNNDYYLSLVYQAVPDCLKNYREEILSIANPCGPESCAKLCFAACRFCSPDFVARIVEVSLQKFAEEISDIPDWTEKSEKVRVALELHKALFNLARVIANMNYEILNEVMNLALSVHERMNAPTPLYDVLSYVMKIQGDIDIFFIRIAMTFSGAECFTTQNEWRRTMHICNEFLEFNFHNRNQLFMSALQFVGNHADDMLACIRKDEKGPTFEQVCQLIHNENYL